MLRYALYTIAYLLMYVIGILLAPILPAFATMQNGPANNGNDYEFGPRLPRWLSWFDTSYDNHLWGDNGWRTEHCPKYWDTYLGEVLWLWRNPIAGFCWSVLAASVNQADSLTVSGDLSANKQSPGWYYIKSSSGLFQFRCYRRFGSVMIGIELGWILDIYIKQPDTAYEQHKKAHFDFQPVIRND